MFSSIASAASLGELPDLALIWKQYNIQAGAARRQHPTRDNPGTAIVLSKAAGNCLQLLVHQQQAAGTDATPPWTMPTKPKTVTAVRMTLHIFALVISNWMQTVTAANNAGRCQQARSSVEQAMQEAGAVA